LFSDRDDANHPPVAIISDGAAKFFDGDPIGKRVRAGATTGPWLTVIGVVGDIREEALELPSQRGTVYIPYEQSSSSISFFNPRDLAIEVRGEPMNLAEAVKREIWSIDPNQTISRISPLEDLVDQQISNRKLQASLLGSFSITATLLAALGVYALLSFAVEARRKEFGIRMALGAGSKDVIASVFAETVLSIVIGSAAGLALSIVMTRSIKSLLYGVTPTDPVTLGGSVLLLLAVAIVAAFLPAWRSTQIDPLIALRED
jgi:putative ABC transport system permease protein